MAAEKAANLKEKKPYSLRQSKMRVDRALAFALGSNPELAGDGQDEASRHPLSLTCLLVSGESGVPRTGLPGGLGARCRTGGLCPLPRLPTPLPPTQMFNFSFPARALLH